MDQSISGISQDNSGDTTVITLNFSKFEETTSVQSGKVEVSYMDGAGVLGNMNIAASDQWALYAKNLQAAQAQPKILIKLPQKPNWLIWLRAFTKGETYESKYIVLTEDLDLGNKIWTPIGTWKLTNTNLQKPFAGTFDGQGHKIFNLYIP